MIAKTLFSAAAAWAALGATGAMAMQTTNAVRQDAPCVTPEQAQGLILLVAPAAIRAVSEHCAPSLPAGSIVAMMPPGAMARYEAASRAAAPRGAQALGALAGTEIPAELAGSLPGMLDMMVGPMIVDEVKAEDCPRIARFVSLLAPLPPENLAEVVTMILEGALNNDADPKLRICPRDDSAA